MEIDYIGILGQSVVGAAALVGQAVAANPWPWLAITGSLAALLALRLARRPR